MKPLNFIITFLILIINLNCNSNTKKKNETQKNYIFFLHNKFVEENPDETYEPKYGVKTEYNKILESFRKDGFIVISEKRKPKADAVSYARKVVKQIDSLITIGIKPNKITVIGTSKGGYIAQFCFNLCKKSKP